MSIGERIFAAVYDPMNRAGEAGWVGRRREGLLSDIHGTVLEIGAGTGANIPHYEMADRVVLAEPSAPMRSRIDAKLLRARVPIEVSPAPAVPLPFDDASFDAVVATLVLCTLPDLPPALAEIRRVLRPGGELRFLEHGAEHHGRRAVWQRRIEPVWRRVGQGCHLTRDPRAAVEAAGFTITHYEVFDEKAPAILRPFCEGIATR